MDDWYWMMVLQIIGSLDNIDESVTLHDAQKLLDGLNEDCKKLLKNIIPAQITVFCIQRVLLNLVSEKVSINDFPTIIKGVVEAFDFSRNILTITEHVRLRLSRQITFKNIDPSGMLNIVTLSAYWERVISNSIISDGDLQQIALPPSLIENFIFCFNETYDRVATIGEMPILVTTAYVRLFVRLMLEKVKPAVVIMSQNEVHPKVKIRSLGCVE